MYTTGRPGSEAGGVNKQPEWLFVPERDRAAVDVVPYKQPHNLYHKQKFTVTKKKGLPMNEFEIKDGVLVKYNGGAADVTVPDGITEISEFAFIDCDTVRSITVPNGVTAIGDRAFYGCKSLRRVTFPESVTFIGENAFEGCEDLKSIGGVSDSYAEIYASNQKIPFQKILLP